MRAVTSSLVSVFATVAVLVGATAVEAGPLGSAGGISVRGGGSPVGRDVVRRASLGQTGIGRDAFGGRAGRGFGQRYGGFGYGAYAASGYYGYGSGYGAYAPSRLPGAGYLDGPYGPLIVPGYGGIPDPPVQPPAIYIIDMPSASAARRPGATRPKLASVTGPGRTGARVIEVPPAPRR